MNASKWQFWIDRGGTFTDCLGRDPVTGALRVAKVLSHDRAPLEGIRQILGLAENAPIPACDVRMGTTLGTNALLERQGARCALVTTTGFADLPLIGDQTRPDLFALNIEGARPLHCATVETGARGTAHAQVGQPVDEESLRPALAALREEDVESLAVVLMHGHRVPEIEQRVADLAKSLGFAHVSVSHEVANEIGMVGRGDTTAVDAYLTPVLRRYLQTLEAELPGSRIRVMQSSGALTSGRRFRGRDSVLSGPAGGVVALAHVAQSMGHDKVIGFDMGGTSTDVSRYDGSFERVYETQVAGVRIRTPMVAIHTVAAGGGSVCDFDGHRFTVGPQSTGANPGPLCYGRPGAQALAVTDINLALGRLPEARFPFPLDRPAVESALDRVCQQLAERGDARSRQAVAEGYFKIAVENMAQAIRKITVARGHDVRSYAMGVFGGAGGQTACAVARRLGIRTLLFHPHAGVLSAFGMGVASLGWHGEVDAQGRALDAVALAELGPALDQLEARGQEQLAADGIPAARTQTTRRLDLRYRGAETPLTLEVADVDPLVAAFEAAHLREYGYTRPEHPIEIVTGRVEVRGEEHDVVDPPASGTAGTTEPDTTRMWHEGRWHDTRVIERESLIPNAPVEGPAIVVEATGTIVVEPGWTLTTDAQGRLTVRDQAPAVADRVGTHLDPVSLEIFNNRYMSIAEQMGTVLRRTAMSTNIRERRDFSCAVFDAAGGLVANAPHIPVHLGAMSESVRAIVAAHPDPEPGDVFVTNDPSGGGSHLPDVTVVTPVFDGDRLAFFTASRGHHADIGGTTPGSMPPDSKTLEDEGVVLRGLRIVHAGEFDRAGLHAVLEGATHPARRPAENIADIEAQIAANRTGGRLLAELVDQYGDQAVDAYMGHVQDNAAATVREAIAALPDGTHRFEDAMDDGTTMAVQVQVKGDRMGVDFTGTAPQVAGNLNAPRAVTVAAVLYVLRTLVGHAIPLNSGCLRPVDLTIPEGCFLNPGPDAAVAAGNVETAQRIVDVLLGALGKTAASQGTMNNLTFGDASFGYYETIGGGAGAGPDFDGRSGVHTHMTNTRITDPEVLEDRFPVRLHRFSLRPGSGGNGAHRGGDGLIRDIEFTSPVRVSILSERRERRPFGLAGGEPGAPGRNLQDGEPLPGRVSVDVPAGGRIRIETPGGGGYGSADPAAAGSDGGSDT